MRRQNVLLVLAILAASAVQAQPDATDEFIRAEMQRQRIPGLSLAVVKDGRIVKTAGYGFADVAQKVPATPQTVYKIASVSKQFIAAGILLLVQEERLALDDPVSKYLEGTPTRWKNVTIRHLLTHTSGLVREGPAFNASKVQADAEVIRSAYDAPLRFVPGDKWEYGNLGYFALAEVIRRVSGRPWTDFLDERVFQPAGMRTTYPTNTKAQVPNRAVGYTDNDRLDPAGDWPALRPSGAFLSTVLDLAKWDAVLETGDILGDSTRRQMWTPAPLNDGTRAPYGFGWFVESTGGRTRVQHTGGMPGARSGFRRFLEDRLTIIVLMNLDDVDIESILDGLTGLHLPSTVPGRARTPVT